MGIRAPHLFSLFLCFRRRGCLLERGFQDLFRGDFTAAGIHVVGIERPVRQPGRRAPLRPDPERIPNTNRSNRTVSKGTFLSM
jgi:hypothetical protein